MIILFNVVLCSSVVGSLRMDSDDDLLPDIQALHSLSKNATEADIACRSECRIVAHAAPKQKPRKQPTSGWTMHLEGNPLKRSTEVNALHAARMREGKSKKAKMERDAAQDAKWQAGVQALQTSGMVRGDVTTLSLQNIDKSATAKNARFLLN